MIDIKSFYHYIILMFYLILFFTLLPSQVWAEDFYAPTVILTERLMLYSLVLIVSLEAWVIYKSLSGLTKKQSLLISLNANLLTMFLVIPIVWGIWLVFLFITPHFIYEYLDYAFGDNILTDFLLAPYVWKESKLLTSEWIMAPVYFIASYYAEYWFSRKKLQDYPQQQVKKAFFFANLYSYLMIMVFETIYQLIIVRYKELNPQLWYLW